VQATASTYAAKVVAGVVLGAGGKESLTAVSHFRRHVMVGIRAEQGRSWAALFHRPAVWQELVKPAFPK
jgi:hypothetical protein